MVQKTKMEAIVVRYAGKQDSDNGKPGPVDMVCNIRIGQPYLSPVPWYPLVHYMCAKCVWDYALANSDKEAP